MEKKIRKHEVQRVRKRNTEIEKKKEWRKEEKDKGEKNK